MIVTDDQLALDAERLAEVADRLERERREIVAIATRLRRRFPADRVLAQAVEEFIGAALGEEQAA